LLPSFPSADKAKAALRNLLAKREATAVIAVVELDGHVDLRICRSEAVRLQLRGRRGPHGERSGVS
jgi:hypothetical protein